MFPSSRATLGGDVFRDEFSVSFDGTDEFIDLGSQDGDLRLSGSNGAIIAWIKPTLTGDDFQRIVDKSDGGNGSNGYALFINNGNVTADADGAIGIGYKALYSLTSGAGNTAVGYLSLASVDDGSKCTAVG